MSINFIYREQNGKVNTKKEPIKETQELKKEYYSVKEKSEHKKHIKNLIIENEKLQVQNDFIGDLKQQIKNKNKIEKIALTNKKSNKEIIPVLVLSDWHIEENVDPNTVNQLNDYNLNIAKQRSEKLIRNVLKMLNKILN